LSEPGQHRHPAHPPLNSHRVRLRPIAERDRGFLYELMCAPDAGGRVRYGGATPSPEQVAASLWENVLAQFVVEGAESATPIGLVAVTTPMFRDGHAYLSAVGTPRAQGSGLVLEAVLLLCNYAFSTWPLRKLYLEATEPPRVPQRPRPLLQRGGTAALPHLLERRLRRRGDHGHLPGDLGQARRGNAGAAALTSPASQATRAITSQRRKSTRGADHEDLHRWGAGLPAVPLLVGAGTR
jgi:hypothetical protein